MATKFWQPFSITIVLYLVISYQLIQLYLTTFIITVNVIQAGETFEGKTWIWNDQMADAGSVINSINIPSQFYNLQIVLLPLQASS